MARLETTAILGALLDQVERIDIFGEPTWVVNNMIHWHQYLPVRLTSA